MTGCYNKYKKKFGNLVYIGEIEEIFEENLFILKMNGGFKLLVDGKFDYVKKLEEKGKEPSVRFKEVEENKYYDWNKKITEKGIVVEKNGIKVNLSLYYDILEKRKKFKFF